MGVSGGFARYCPQAEALGGIEAGAADPAVVEGNAFGLAVFEEKFAVLRAREGVAQDCLDLRPVEAGAVEEQVVGNGEVRHDGFSRTSAD